MRAIETSSLSSRSRRRRVLAGLIVSSAVLLVAFRLVGQKEQAGFPDGYDAVQVAGRTHKVVFENAFVRVLEVTIPPAGTTIPMHHHRWPSFFLSWDTGGRSAHIRYHRPDGSVKDSPSRDTPAHLGSWDVHWKQPEPMHAIEVVEAPQGAPGPPDLRIEIKCAR